MKPRIFLFGTITKALSLKVVRKIKYLVDNGVESIYLYICSDGGEFDYACAIIDEMLGAQSIGVSVYTICQSSACSSAADILILGSPGYRFCTKNTTIMLHPLSYTVNEDYSKSQKILTEHMDRRSEEINVLVAKACGYTTKAKAQNFIEETAKGLWLTGKEAIKKGVVDGFWDYKQEVDIPEIKVAGVD